MNDPFVYSLKISSFFAKLREKIFSVENTWNKCVTNVCWRISFRRKIVKSKTPRVGFKHTLNVMTGCEIADVNKDNTALNFQQEL